MKIRGIFRVLLSAQVILMLGWLHAQELPPAEAKICPATPPNLFPINLPTALKLAGVQPIDIALAAQRTQIAAAQMRQADVAWLPNLYMGVQYDRHDGQIQDVAGKVFTTSRSSTFVGAGPVLNLALTEAIYEPLAACQRLAAAKAYEQSAANDTMLSVAEAYFNVQLARGELAGATETLNRMNELTRRTDKLSPGLISPADASRARAELARRQQAIEFAEEHWRTASSDLVNVLQLDPIVIVNPAEPPQLLVTLLDCKQCTDELIPIALTHRPELAANQAIVQATLARLKQEKMRPLIPSLVFRPASTSPSNFFAGGYFGGGTNGNQSNFGGRSDFDFQVVWELRNLGAGNKALVDQRRGENQLAILELMRTQDRIAAEVVRAMAQVKSASVRAQQAECGLREAVDAADRSLEGLSQTRRAGEVIVFVVRPQEAVAAMRALADAYTDYYGAIADANRAQFRLYRALGHPAQCVEPTLH